MSDFNPEDENSVSWTNDPPPQTLQTEAKLWTNTSSEPCGTCEQRNGQIRISWGYHFHPFCSCEVTDVSVDATFHNRLVGSSYSITSYTSNSNNSDGRYRYVTTVTHYTNVYVYLDPAGYSKRLETESVKTEYTYDGFEKYDWGMD